VAIQTDGCILVDFLSLLVFAWWYGSVGSVVDWSMKLINTRPG